MERVQRRPDRIVESMAQVDTSSIRFPMVVIYERPKDYPDAYVGRLWDAIGPEVTTVIIKRAALKELREDLRRSGYMTRIMRDDKDEPQVVESWMR